MTLLDTDIVTLHEYGKSEKLRARIGAAPGGDLAVAVITRMERLQGRFASIMKAANGAELLTAIGRFRITEALLASFRAVGVDAEAARLFDQLRADRKLKMRRGDMLIACIALANDALLVTRNVKDYEGIAGLRVENWAD